MVKPAAPFSAMKGHGFLHPGALQDVVACAVKPCYGAVKLYAGDEKQATGHMTIGVDGVHWVLKAAAKTAENSVRCPGT
jgi:hypothetical protein